MRIEIEVGVPGHSERTVEASIAQDEFAGVHLHFAFPEGRNRTRRYMRRHQRSSTESVAPNQPIRDPLEPAKLSIPEHMAALRQAGILSQAQAGNEGSSTFREEPIVFAVPISDLAANLLRPAFHSDGIGGHRLFFFDDEPVGEREYWCLCYFSRDSGRPPLELRRLTFDPIADQIATGGASGLIWAAGVVPLVCGGEALSAVEIAQNDYDLRQIVGREAEASISAAYQGWYQDWNARVAELVETYVQSGAAFARFYHSVIALHANGDVHLRQVEADLPGLACTLAAEGFQQAAMLDSGGSCAMYDGGLRSYLNHSWYFREPRGSVLVFELKAKQRLPDRPSNSWAKNRR